MKILLHILATYFFATGIYIWFAPNAFYENTPGLSDMGPFSIHFIRDVALTYLASGGAIFYGALKDNRTALICGAVWPLLHALFHIQIWGHRGFPFDNIWATNAFGVVLPGFVAIGLALKFRPATA